MHNTGSMQSCPSIFGIYFCPGCKNMMIPNRAQGTILEFKCRSCGPREVDFNNRFDKECMLYSKELAAGSKRSVAQLQFIFDQTMPRVKIRCPECLESNEAVYFLSPDDDQRKIVVKLICASATDTTAKCGNIWDLSEEDEIYEDIIREGKNALMKP